MLRRISTLKMNRGIYLTLSLGFLLVFSTSLIASAPPPPTGPEEERSTKASDDLPAPKLPLAYPPNPSADIPWSGGTSGVADIQAAFNHARNEEELDLGISLPSITMPSQSTWNAKSNSEKAMWLINRERLDRGVKQLHGVETNVRSVAQNYANYLLAHNAFSHTADGHDPWWRLDQNPAIGACHDFLNVAENLAVFWTSGSSIPLPVERAVYMWMYEDSGMGWGHRIAILWYPYNENSGSTSKEGFLGIGRASGPHMGWPFGEIIVMNVFDPCASWNYGVTVLPADIWLPYIRNNHR